jgi:hypothetical protein
MVATAHNPSSDESLRLSYWMMGGGALALFVTMLVMTWFVEKLSLRLPANLPGVNKSPIEHSVSLTGWDLPGIGRWLCLGTIMVALGSTVLVATHPRLQFPAQWRICVAVTVLSILAAGYILFVILENPESNGTGTAQVQVVSSNQSASHTYWSSHAPGGNVGKSVVRVVPVRYAHSTKIGTWLGFIAALVIVRGALFWFIPMAKLWGRPKGR